MKLTLKRLEEIARKNMCVLEKESRGYSLWSNKHFVGTDCKTLIDVYSLLTFDQSFR